MLHLRALPILACTSGQLRVEATEVAEDAVPAMAPLPAAALPPSASALGVGSGGSADDAVCARGGGSRGVDSRAVAGCDPGMAGGAVATSADAWPISSSSSTQCLRLKNIFEMTRCSSAAAPPLTAARCSRTLCAPTPDATRSSPSSTRVPCARYAKWCPQAMRAPLAIRVGAGPRL